ncbi:MAG: CooT family nickel-binding protein [Firmicutes bacterium]|jgi:predicted RNA-binding protein|nr:CooT family nickel-binding protein [Bacillota bacterium]
MCLSTVYEQSGSERKMLARNVESVNLRDGKLVFTDILGASKVFEGVIQQIDLTENFIIVKHG